MWLTLTTIFCAAQILMQQCFGIKFIDLPAFGSNEGKDPIEMMHGSGGVAIKEVAPDQLIVVKKSSPPNFEALRRRLNYESHIKTPKETHVKSAGTNKVKYEPYYLIPPVAHEPSKVDSNFQRLELEPKTVTNQLRRLLPKEPPSIPSDPVIMRRENNADELDGNLKHKIATLVDQTMHDTELKVKNIMKAKEKHRDKPAYKIGFILSMVKKTRDVLNELFNVAVKHRDDWKALEQLKVFELIVHTNVDTTNLVRQLVEIHIQNLNSTNTVERSGKRRVVVLR